jgi:NAD(P)-dependent dehydrogenase (short-subunit alcohol dehydrogenase family)
MSSYIGPPHAPSWARHHRQRGVGRWQARLGDAAAYCASKFGLTGLTQALNAEGKPFGIRACIVYSGDMATNWGVWSPAERSASARQVPALTQAFPPQEVAALIVWIASAPPELVLNEVIVTALEERG